jgi:arsenate reductase (thioredoxin)
MAEGFANLYGGDVLRAFSAGLAPVATIAPATVGVMQEKNIDVSEHVPDLYDPLFASRCDLVVNMSGYKLPGAPPPNLVEWVVPDPYRSSLKVYRAVRDDLEQRVMQLIMQLRRKPKP